MKNNREHCLKHQADYQLIENVRRWESPPN
jgi:hypothetical protein